nr:glycoside hydrolase family 3 C-terminal domain-containing protein [uncultured Acetatifactor sp.]
MDYLADNFARIVYNVLYRLEWKLYYGIVVKSIVSEYEFPEFQEAAARSVVLLKNEGGLLPLDKSGLKTIGVIGPNANNRRALAVNWADEHVPAILQGWYPGAEGGRAMAEILFGDRCPEGKLPVTFYHSSEELPDFADYHMKGRTYRYMEQEALYPFGYGMSYTDFTYKNVCSDSAVLSKEGITLGATVKNTGKVAGGETVQVYVKICGDGTPGSGILPNVQLKGICKLHLSPGEAKEAVIHLPAEAFGL